MYAGEDETRGGSLEVGEFGAAGNTVTWSQGEVEWMVKCLRGVAERDGMYIGIVDIA